MPRMLTADAAIRQMAFDTDGSLWAATGGGVLCWKSGQPLPKRWTVAEGLSSEDVRSITPEADGIQVMTAAGRDWIHRSGAVTPLAPVQSPAGGKQSDASAKDDPIGTMTASVTTPSGEYRATSLGLWHKRGAHWAAVALPPNSPASHVSALCWAGDKLYAGLYGDGVYLMTLQGWQRIGGTSAVLGKVTALAWSPKSGLTVGTADRGIWQPSGADWQAKTIPDSLPSADIQSVVRYQGALWAATLDQGLLRLPLGTEKSVWEIVNGLRSQAPRNLVIFQDRIYVREATGDMDVCDAQGCRAAFPHDPQAPKQIYSVATDGKRLFLGGWEGWGATDGTTWERHFHRPELAGEPVTAIARSDDGTVWLGTQRQGLFAYQNDTVKHYYESQGLTDDWITSLAVWDNRLLVGTYTGGLLEKQGDRFAVLLQPQGMAIRAIVRQPDTGKALVATPLGVYAEPSTSGPWQLMDPLKTGTAEAQCLLPDDGGFWIGSRTRLVFLPNLSAGKPMAAVQ